MSRFDRRMIGGLLTKHFPSMANATSDEWHGFLNAETGLSVDIDAPNAEAFDQWRKALAEKNGLPVWAVTSSRMAEIAAKGVAMKKAEDLRRTTEQETLAAARMEAPTVKARDLLK